MNYYTEVFYTNKKGFASLRSLSFNIKLTHVSFVSLY